MLRRRRRVVWAVFQACAAAEYVAATASAGLCSAAVSLTASMQCERGDDGASCPATGAQTGDVLQFPICIRNDCFTSDGQFRVRAVVKKSASLHIIFAASRQGTSKFQPARMDILTNTSFTPAEWAGVPSQDGQESLPALEDALKDNAWCQGTSTETQMCKVLKLNRDITLKSNGQCTPIGTLFGTVSDTPGTIQSREVFLNVQTGDTDVEIKDAQCIGTNSAGAHGSVPYIVSGPSPPRHRRSIEKHRSSDSKWADTVAQLKNFIWWIVVLALILLAIVCAVAYKLGHRRGCTKARRDLMPLLAR